MIQKAMIDNYISLLNTKDSALIHSAHIISSPAAIALALVVNAIQAGSTKIAIDIGGCNSISVSDNGPCFDRHDFRYLVQKGYSSNKMEYEHSRGSSLADMSHVATICIVSLSPNSFSRIEAAFFQENAVFLRKFDAKSNTFHSYIDQLDSIQSSEPTLKNVIEIPQILPGYSKIVQASNVFSHIPVRKKYFKDRYQATINSPFKNLFLKDICDALSPVLLSHPRISFTISDSYQGINLMKTSGKLTLDAVFGQIFGTELVQIPISINLEHKSVLLHGFFSSVLSHNPNMQYIYINNYYVKHFEAYDVLNELVKTFKLNAITKAKKFSIKEASNPEMSKYPIYCLLLNFKDESEITVDFIKEPIHNNININITNELSDIFTEASKLFLSKISEIYFPKINLDDELNYSLDLNCNKYINNNSPTTHIRTDKANDLFLKHRKRILDVAHADKRPKSSPGMITASIMNDENNYITQSNGRSYVKINGSFNKDVMYVDTLTGNAYDRIPGTEKTRAISSCDDNSPKRRTLLRPTMMGENSKLEIEFQNEDAMVKWGDNTDDIINPPSNLCMESLQTNSELEKLHSSIRVSPYSRVTKDDINEMKIIGQADYKFIITFIDKGEYNKFFVIDQHAADERIHLEQLEDQLLFLNEKNCIMRTDFESAKYIYLSFSNSEVLSIMLHKSKLENWGILIDLNKDKKENQQTNVIKIKGIPRLFKSRLINKSDNKILKQFLLETVYWWTDNEYMNNKIKDTPSISNLPPSFRQILNSIACRTAIKFGTELTKSKILNILEKLSTCKNPFHCAHGRPSIVPLGNY